MQNPSVSARGKVTVQKEILERFGVEAAGSSHVDLPPGGRAGFTSERGKRSFREWRGCLENKNNGARLGIDEICEAIAESGAESGPRLALAPALAQ